MTDFLSFVTSARPDNAEDAKAAGQATACLRRFTEAFNICDLRAMDGQLHFPHTMLSGAEVLVWQSPGQHPEDFFDQLRASGWHETRYEAIEPVLVVSNKVHFVVTYVRLDQAGQTLSRHRNLWVVVEREGRWGIILRSY